METYLFLNAKDRAAGKEDGKTSYCYKTAERVAAGKKGRDSDGFFLPYAMFRPHRGTGLLCSIFGETPSRKAEDVKAAQDMLAKEAYEHEVELLMCQTRSSELQIHGRFAKEDLSKEYYEKAAAEGLEMEAPEMTAPDTRQIILDAVTWRYDWIQRRKKDCYRFAELTLETKESGIPLGGDATLFIQDFIMDAAMMPEPNRVLIDYLYEAAWYSIYQYKYGAAGEKVPEPWYDKVGGGA